MITGTHSIISSTNPEKDRDFFLNVLKLPNVDVGNGWLIFGLPPSEVAIHPASKNNLHEFYLMCDDIRQFVKEMAKHKITCSSIQDQGWGLISQITLPGGGKLSIYEPRHARPKQMKVKVAAKKPIPATSKK
ncbi:MAG: extradiol dioxygenase [Ferruginibacter sp.]